MGLTLQSLLGFEMSAAAQYVVAFMTIFVLLALFALVLRRVTGNKITLAGQERGRSRQPRLGLVDTYDLDRQRQLILVRRDNIEHLIMIGGPNDVLVEGNIVKSQAGLMAQAPVIGRVVSNAVSDNELSPSHAVGTLNSAGSLTATSTGVENAPQSDIYAQPQLSEVRTPQMPITYSAGDTIANKGAPEPALALQPTVTNHNANLRETNASQRPDVKVDQQRPQQPIRASSLQNSVSPVENNRAQNDVKKQSEIAVYPTVQDTHAHQNTLKADIANTVPKTVTQELANKEFTDPALADMARQLEILLNPTITVQNSAKLSMPSTQPLAISPSIPKVEQRESYNPPLESVVQKHTLEPSTAQPSKPAMPAPTYRAPINQETPKVSSPTTAQNFVAAASAAAATVTAAIATPDKAVTAPQFSPHDYKKNIPDSVANVGSNQGAGANRENISENDALEMLSIEAIEAEFARLLGRSAEN